MSIHYLYFADDLGIATIFPALKDRLAEPGHQHVSLLYYSVNNTHIFKKELEILQKHFPSQFLVSYLSKALTGQWIFQQDDVESVLNANTMQHMRFIISGNEAFAEHVKDQLTFLGITTIQIQEQYFSE